MLVEGKGTLCFCCDIEEKGCENPGSLKQVSEKPPVEAERGEALLRTGALGTRGFVLFKLQGGACDRDESCDHAMSCDDHPSCNHCIM